MHKRPSVICHWQASTVAYCSSKKNKFHLGTEHETVIYGRDMQNAIGNLVKIRFMGKIYSN